MPRLKKPSKRRSRHPLWTRPPVPNGFWSSRTNRRRYMRRLGQQLGYSKPKDWYQVTTDDFKPNHGASVLAHHWDSSSVAAVMECFPNHDWKEWLFGDSPIALVRDADLRRVWYEWMFACVPRGFWEQPENRLRYVAWLGKRLKFTRPGDWSKIRRRDFCDNYGGALLARYRSYSDLLAECVPRLLS